MAATTVGVGVRDNVVTEIESPRTSHAVRVRLPRQYGDGLLSLAEIHAVNAHAHSEYGLSLDHTRDNDLGVASEIARFASDAAEAARRTCSEQSRDRDQECWGCPHRSLVCERVL